MQANENLETMKNILKWIPGIGIGVICYEINRLIDIDADRKEFTNFHLNTLLYQYHKLVAVIGIIYIGFHYLG